MLKSTLPPAAATPPHEAGATPDRIESLNADGGLNWFIPPYVIPIVAGAAIFASVLFRAYS